MKNVRIVRNFSSISKRFFAYCCFHSFSFLLFSTLSFVLKRVVIQNVCVDQTSKGSCGTRRQISLQWYIDFIVIWINFYCLGKFANWFRYFCWTYGWDGKTYGLQFNDQYFEPAPEVKEALRRLNLQDPYEFDQRKIRLTRAHNLAMKNERLPKDQWTKWEDVSFYIVF